MTQSRKQNQHFTDVNGPQLINRPGFAMVDKVGLIKAGLHF